MICTQPGTHGKRMVFDLAELTPSQSRYWWGPRSQEVREERDCTWRHTITIIMTACSSKLAAVIELFLCSVINCYGHLQSQDDVYKQQLLKREEGKGHTPSIAFRHLPPKSARFSYATEGALFISAQLSNDAVSALERFGYWYDCRSNLAPKHARKHETQQPRVKKKSSVPIQKIVVLFVLV